MSEFAIWRHPRLRQHQEQTPVEGLRILRFLNPSVTKVCILLWRNRPVSFPDLLCADRVIDIFELAESLEPNFNIDDIKQVNKFEQIQRVIDGLLSFAHGVIQKDQKTRDRGKEPALTRHDAVPVFYVRQSGPGVALGAAVSLPAQIATAVHTSGYNASYRFRIDQHSTDKFPHGYTYTSIDEAKAAMKREFTPVFEGTLDVGQLAFSRICISIADSVPTSS